MTHLLSARVTGYGFFLTLAILNTIAAGVGVDAQRIVARRATAVLPPELNPFFSERIADLEERTTELDRIGDRDAKLEARAKAAHLWMDVKAQHGSASARLTAAEAFPHREADAKALFKSLGLERQGGRLPWMVEDAQTQLVRAFEKGEADDIVRLSGHLAYFAWAASQPFNATMNHDGRDGGNVYLGELSAGDPYYPHQSVHFRVMGELVRRNRSRYLEQVQVRPLDVQPLAEPVEPCFRHLLGALGRLDDLLTADREITARLGATDGATLLQREDEFYQLLDARCGEIVVDRLRAGALLAADLIVGAWERAGRPVLPGLARPSPATSPSTDDAQTPPRSEPRRPAPAGPVAYVGSKSSKVFHRADCVHVKRINPANQVTYAYD